MKLTGKNSDGYEQFEGGTNIVPIMCSTNSKNFILDCVQDLEADNSIPNLAKKTTCNSTKADNPVPKAEKKPRVKSKFTKKTNMVYNERVEAVKLKRKSDG